MVTPLAPRENPPPARVEAPLALAQTVVPDASSPVGDSFAATVVPETVAVPVSHYSKTVDLPHGAAPRDAAVDVSAVAARTLLPSEANGHDAISFAATVAPVSLPVSSAGSLSPASLSPASLSPASQLRSTVLPRVEMVGSERRMVLAPQLRYQEERLLGAGGVGEVVKVRDNDIERTVALKRIKADVRSPATVLRFMDEIRTVGRLEHPNIVPIHDVGVDEQGQYFFVMKYVNGETLEDIIEKLAQGDPVYLQQYSFEKRVQIFNGILEAIAYAHAQGIIHRDIKPANIMVGPYGEVVVMDWGLAKRIRGEGEVPSFGPASAPAPAASADDRRALYKTRVGSLLGTPAYMSPEQARGQNDIDERSDVYSLSALFYELLALRHYLPPQENLAGMLAAVTTEPHVMIAQLPALAQGGVPAELCWLVERGLAKDPAARYQSVSEMIRMLQARSEGHIEVRCPVTMVKSGTRWWLRWVDNNPGLMMGGLSLAVLLMLTGLGLGGYHLVMGLMAARG
jgi:serine/threonine-protein kinase